MPSTVHKLTHVILIILRDKNNYCLHCTDEETEVRGELTRSRTTANKQRGWAVLKNITKDISERISTEKDFHKVWIDRYMDMLQR